MDLFYHFFIGMIISKLFLGYYSLPVIISSGFIDIIGIIPFIVQKIINQPKKVIKDWLNGHVEFYSNTEKIVYRTTHSLLFAIFFTIICYIFFNKIGLIMGLANLSHLLIDIFTHNNDFSTRLLYPFSDFHVKGKNWNIKEPRFYLFWILGIVIFIFLI